MTWKVGCHCPQPSHQRAFHSAIAFRPVIAPDRSTHPRWWLQPARHQPRFINCEKHRRREAQHGRLQQRDGQRLHKLLARLGRYLDLTSHSTLQPLHLTSTPRLSMVVLRYDGGRRTIMIAWYVGIGPPTRHGSNNPLAHAVVLKAISPLLNVAILPKGLPSPSCTSHGRGPQQPS